MRGGTAPALLASLLFACGGEGERAGGRAFLVRDLEPGPASSHPYSFVALDERLVFTAVQRSIGTGLWVTDGSAAGTVRLDPRGAASGSAFVGTAPYHLTRVGSRVFFAASDEEHGNELWVTDGTSAGTRLVKDINPGPDQGPGAPGSSSPENITDMDGIAYFTACDEEHGEEVWRSDGTETGTWRVTDAYPGPGPRSGPWLSACFVTDGPEFLTAWNGVLYFVAPHPAYGHEVWRTDGTPEGTRLLKDVEPGPDRASADGPAPAWPRDLTATHGALFFASRAGLWRTDGTEAGTVLIAPGWSRRLVSTDRLLFFAGPGREDGGTLWRSDGSAAGTYALADVTLGSGVGSVNRLSEMQPLGDRLYFEGRTAQYGWELWTSDGTRAGTGLAADVRPGSPDSNPHALISVGNAMVFTAEDAAEHPQLWAASDSAVARLTDIEGGVQTSAARPGVRAVARLGNLVLFPARTEAEGVELWAYRFTN